MLIANADRKRLSRARSKESFSGLGFRLLHLIAGQFLPSSKWDALSSLCLVLVVSPACRLLGVSVSARESASYSEVRVARRVLFARGWTRAWGKESGRGTDGEKLTRNRGPHTVVFSPSLPEQM